MLRSGGRRQVRRRGRGGFAKEVSLHPWRTLFLFLNCYFEVCQRPNKPCVAFIDTHPPPLQGDLHRILHTLLKCTETRGKALDFIAQVLRANSPRAQIMRVSWCLVAWFSLACLSYTRLNWCGLGTQLSILWSLSLKDHLPLSQSQSLVVSECAVFISWAHRSYLRPVRVQPDGEPQLSCLLTDVNYHGTCVYT